MSQNKIQESTTHQSYFYSDPHFSHKNVIKYDNRPFNSVEEMNNTIIENHNSVVGENDDSFCLGDFSFDKRRTEEFLLRLICNC